MRTLLAITIIVLSMALLGWITFSADDAGASIRVDTDEATKDLEYAGERTSDAIDGAVDRVRETDDN